MAEEKSKPRSNGERDHQDNLQPPDAAGMSRRGFLGAAAAGAATATAVGAGLVTGPEVAAHPNWDDWRENSRDKSCPRFGHRDDRILLKGGVVLSLDPAVGNFEKADVLIEGKTIKAVAPNIHASAQVIDCTGMIVMPGFINTHHHQYYAPQRAIISDGNILPTDAWPQEAYQTVPGAIWTTGRVTYNGSVIWDLGRSPYDPEDCYIAELVASINQINQGVTTGVDTSQSSHTPQHTDAMIEGIIASGRRTLYAYSSGRSDQPGYEYPGALGDMTKGLGRLKSTYFSSNDQLATVALNTSFNVANYQLARSLGVPLVQHEFAGAAGVASGLLGPDNEYIHNTSGMTPEFWQVIADTGGHVSCAPTIEMQMGHGIPTMQDCLDHGILPSLSSDVESNMTPNMFTIMRSAFTCQRMNIHTRNRNGEANVPPLLTCYQVIQMATIAGAKCAHVENKVGTLTPGKEADIIVLDGRASNTAGYNNVPGAIVTLMDTSNVVHVLIAGNIRKWNGKLVGVESGQIGQRRRAVAGQDLRPHQIEADTRRWTQFSTGLQSNTFRLVLRLRTLSGEHVNPAAPSEFLPRWPGRGSLVSSTIVAGEQRRRDADATADHGAERAHCQHQS